MILEITKQQAEIIKTTLEAAIGQVSSSVVTEPIDDAAEQEALVLTVGVWQKIVNQIQFRLDLDAEALRQT